MWKGTILSLNVSWVLCFFSVIFFGFFKKKRKKPKESKNFSLTWFHSSIKSLFFFRQELWIRCLRFAADNAMLDICDCFSTKLLDCWWYRSGDLKMITIRFRATLWVGLGWAERGWGKWTNCRHIEMFRWKSTYQSIFAGEIAVKERRSDGTLETLISRRFTTFSSSLPDMPYSNHNSRLHFKCWLFFFRLFLFFSLFFDFIAGFVFECHE